MLDGRVGIWDTSPFSHWEASVGGVRSLLDSAALCVIRTPQHIITTLSLSSDAAILVPYFFPASVLIPHALPLPLSRLLVFSFFFFLSIHLLYLTL